MTTKRLRGATPFLLTATLLGVGCGAPADEETDETNGAVSATPRFTGQVGTYVGPTLVAQVVGTAGSPRVRFAEKERRGLADSGYVALDDSLTAKGNDTEKKPFSLRLDVLDNRRILLKGTYGSKLGDLPPTGLPESAPTPIAIDETIVFQPISRWAGRYTSRSTVPLRPLTISDVTEKGAKVTGLGATIGAVQATWATVGVTLEFHAPGPVGAENPKYELEVADGVLILVTGDFALDRFERK